MYNFEQHLKEGEKILYTGVPVVGKGSKGLGGLMFLFFFVLGMMALMIWSLVNKEGDSVIGINFAFIFIFGVLFFFLGVVIWGIVYNLFLKKNAIKDDFYCLTNERALKYESKKNKLVYGYLKCYEIIRVNYEKDGYGDVYMAMLYSGYGDSRHNLTNITKLMTKPDPENMPFITFESVENPQNVVSIIRDIKNK